MLFRSHRERERQIERERERERECGLRLFPWRQQEACVCVSLGGAQKLLRPGDEFSQNAELDQTLAWIVEVSIIVRRVIAPSNHYSRQMSERKS